MRFTNSCRWVMLLMLLLAWRPAQAEQPNMVVVANQSVAARLVEMVGPTLPVSVLIVGESDDVSTLNGRALQMQEARVFVFESDRESLLEAMYRERLVQHGVKAVDLTPLTRHRTSPSSVDPHRQLPQLLAAWQTIR